MKKMFAKIAPVLILLLLLQAIWTGCAGTPSNPAENSAAGTGGGMESTANEMEKAELLISAAASLTDVMRELENEYAKTAPEVILKFNFGSSGALQTQIEEGAPADVFISAGIKQMDALDEKELLLNGTKTELLENKIVLIIPAGSEIEIGSFEDIAGEKVKMVALGESKAVPVGQYSEEIFKNLGILDKITAKANYGSNVRQVLSWVENGEVDCGVVYSTDAISSNKVKAIAEAPEGSHSPVIYPAAVISASPYPEQAKEFIKFLSSEAAVGIFAEYGFTVR